MINLSGASLMSYKVTVIIPTYNAEKTISKTINSVINQTLGFNNIELIIVDDNSNDGTVNILKKYSKQYDNIKCYFKNKNSGVGNSRNMGIKNTNAKYLMFLDSDDIYQINMCEVLYNTIEENNVNIVMCNHQQIHNSYFNYNESNLDTSYVSYSSNNDLILFKFKYMWDKIYNKEFLNKFNIQCIENCWGEDTHFCINCYLKSDKIIYLKNYHGYVYNVRDTAEDLSSFNNFTTEDCYKFINGLYLTIDLLKTEKRKELIDYIMKDEFLILISQFVRLDANINSKISILEEILKLQSFSGFNQKLDEKWANWILNNIKTKKFKRIIFFSKFLNKIYKVNFFRKIYRHKYNKGSSQ